MDRMIPFLKRIPALFALVLLAGLVAGCPVGLVDDIANNNPPDTPVITILQEHTPTSANSTSNFIGISSSTANIGLGQRILHPQAYLPHTFSVWIDEVYPFKDGSGTGTAVEVSLQLKVWNASGTELGNSSATVPANYTGEVLFTITGVTGPIPANTAIIYAVFNKTAVANDVRGQLERDNTNGYDPHADADMMSTFTSATDANVDVFSRYSASSNDLRFKLTGSEP